MLRFARIYGGLRGIGQGIGVSDTLVAATAIEQALVLVTRNRRHYRRIPELPLCEPS